LAGNIQEKIFLKIVFAKLINRGPARAKMPMKITEKIYKEYVKNYEPFPWDRREDVPFPEFRGKHTLLISFIRYYKVLEYLQSCCSGKPVESIVDVGPFPGIMVQLIKEFMGKEIKYMGVGLHFSDEYLLAMEKLAAKLFSTDFDPEFIEAEECKEWPVEENDVCLLLDVIEHLVNPVYCLDKINHSLKVGGHLILTTDNMTPFGRVYSMAKTGGSPNVHPMQSSLFYRGAWRPHFREYSKDELIFYLQHCGFKVVKHEYFERKQACFYLDKKGNVFEKSKYTGLKGAIKKIIVTSVPHLRDHQILIAEKKIDYKDNVCNRPQPTHSKEEWLKMRAEAKVY